MTELPKVYLGLGSNLGNRHRNIEQAVKILSEQVMVRRVSNCYQTPPMYNECQPPFLNAVLVGTTLLKPRELLRFVQEIEGLMGRVPGPRNSPRSLDIDLLIYGDLVIDEPDLIIPHPAIEERPFVLVPLAELDPAVASPTTGKTALQMLSEASGTESVTPYDAEGAYWAGLKRGRQDIPLKDPHRVRETSREGADSSSPIGS